MSIYSPIQPGAGELTGRHREIDALDELIRSRSASFEGGPAWRGDATLELFDSPAEELARLRVEEIIGGYYRQVGVTWDGGRVLATRRAVAH